jgi:hypothetical protein
MNDSLGLPGLLDVSLDIFSEITVPAIVAALISWLGLVQANRIRERDSGDVDQEIQRLRGDLDATIRKLQAALDQSVHIHNVQFEKEFEAYRKIWASVVDLQQATLALRGPGEAGTNGAHQQCRLHRLKVHARASADLLDAIHKNRPFYAEPVYRKVEGLWRLCARQQRSYRTALQRGNMAAYWTEATSHADEILRWVDETCNGIRNRLAEIGAIPEELNGRNRSA